MAETDGTRKISSSEWEDIDIKPPIDLIPDEFVRETNGNVLVELVCGEDDYEAKEFKQTLENLGFTVNETCKERQKMDKTVDDEWISKVLEKTAIQEYDGLIMIFAKVVYRNDDMKNIWSKFTAKTCPKLKNKPKIFIFQILKKSAEYDNTAISLNWLAAYDTPAEADILIIYDRYDLDRRDLFDQLRTCIQNHGEKEDIFTLASLSYGHNYQPLLISTLTRKFYFTIHKHRGHHLSFHKKYKELEQHIDKVKKQLAKGATDETKKKKDGRIVRALKKTFSFRKKDNHEKSENHEEKSEISPSSNGKVDTKVPQEIQNAHLKEKSETKVEPNNTAQDTKEANNKPVIRENKKEAQLTDKATNEKTVTITSITRNSVRKSSLSTVSISEKRNSRIRTVSVSSDVKVEPAKTKPWKPI